MFKTLPFAALFLAVPVAAEQQAVPTPSPSAAPAQADKKVCRRLATTGSIMPGQRVCHTRSEWQAIDATNAATLDHAMDQRSRGGLGG